MKVLKSFWACSLALSILFIGCSKENSQTTSNGSNKVLMTASEYNEAWSIGIWHNEALDHITTYGNVATMSLETRMDAIIDYGTNVSTIQTFSDAGYSVFDPNSYASIAANNTIASIANDLYSNSQIDENAYDYMVSLDDIYSDLLAGNASVESAKSQFTAISTQVYNDNDLDEDFALTLVELSSIMYHSVDYWNTVANDINNPWYNYASNQDLDINEDFDYPISPEVLKILLMSIDDILCYAKYRVDCPYDGHDACDQEVLFNCTLGSGFYL